MKTQKGSVARQVRKLQQENQNLRSSLLCLIYTGEFATWLEKKEMPCAAWKELEEARIFFPDINFKKDQ